MVDRSVSLEQRPYMQYRPPAILCMCLSQTGVNITYKTGVFQQARTVHVWTPCTALAGPLSSIQALWLQWRGVHAYN